ncbi:hypothetical protein CEXT_294441 [Caerostris extrusa]|uniref:Uncharacterized protein n=1 Tax=Caerostris extrusa TaxID=172846 RepID=A0AAV4URD3_CAEEX|nr:hypothetical protein CEXT_294441 [Caerostris extrusa]
MGQISASSIKGFLMGFKKLPHKLPQQLLDEPYVNREYAAETITVQARWLTSLITVFRSLSKQNIFLDATSEIGNKFSYYSYPYRSIRVEEVNASLKRSFLWSEIQILRQIVNMRVLLGGNSHAQECTDALLKIGRNLPEENNQIKLPETLIKDVPTVE